MRTVSKAIVVLVLSALMVGPFQLVAPAAVPIAYAQLSPSDVIGDLIPADKLLPDGLISEENREELEKSFKKGVAACAIMTYILYVINTGSFKVPVEDFAAVLKDNFIDCVMYHVINVLIEDMLRSLTAWVQGGFKGNPVFVTRLNGYIKNLADQVAGEFLDYVGLSFCSPFRAQIRLHLLETYRESRGDLFNPSCTFTQSLENVGRFLSGDFRAGGWDTWFETWNNPYNNPYGAYVESLDRLSLQIDGATSEATLDINLGNGFLSRKRQVCYAYPNADQAGPPQAFTVGDGETTLQARERQGINSNIVECDDPEIVTPGRFIEEQINEKYGAPGRRLEMADEMNELINAVILFLVGNIFKSEDGLAGYQIDGGDSAADLLDPTIDDNPPAGAPDTTPGDSEPAGPPGPSMCFERRGVFLQPTQGGIVTAGFEFGVPQNVSYDRIEFELDVKNNGWPEDRERWPAGIFWFVRRTNKNMFGYAKVNAPPQNSLMLRHGVGQSHDFKPKVVAGMEFPEGATYRYRLVYDAAGRQIALTATDVATGQVVRTLGSTPDVPGINVGNEKFLATFGYSETEANPRERPMYGWEYSNLKVSFISNGDAPEACASPRPLGGGSGGTGGGRSDKPGDEEELGGGGGDGPVGGGNDIDETQAF